MKPDTILRARIVALCLLFIARSAALAQGTAFTYQGRLNDGANPANGIYDLRFAIYDAVTNGVAQGAPLTNAPASVSNGLFTATLDFGASAFTGANRWLEIGVRTNGSASAYQSLNPRQPLTATPYAIRAANATAFTNSISDSQLSTNIARLTNGVLPISHGGTGSETQNFVDLSTTQTGIGGDKTFTGDLTVSGGSLALANATANVVSFASVGFAPPSPSSVGWKIKTYGNEFGLGIDNSSQWYAAGLYHRWYNSVNAGASHYQTMLLDSSGNLVLNSSSGKLSFGNTGVAPPSPASLGWKIRTYNNGNAYGIGIDANTQWYAAGGDHRWYSSADGGTTWMRTMNLDSSGSLSTPVSIAVGPVAVLPAVGRFHLSGTSAEVSVSDRASGVFVNSPSSGERWVNYVTNGVFRWWSGSDKLMLDNNATLWTAGNGATAPPPGDDPGIGLMCPLAGAVVGNSDGALSPGTPGGGWGRAVYFNGGPAYFASAGKYWGGNSDPLFIARYNVAANSSELRVGIGDDAAASDKFVIGIMPNSTWTPKFSVDGTGAVRAAGTITASTTPDLAETIPAADDVESGDIVCADPHRRERAIRCGKNDRAILGVISDGTGGFLINANAHSADAPLTGKPLVLAGRVPVKVSLENGSIQIGDSLAPSSTPGVAMRAAAFGPTVGIALEAFDGSNEKQRGKALCFVKAGEGNAARLQEFLKDKEAEIQELKRSVAELKALVSKLAGERNSGANRWSQGLQARSADLH